MATCSVLWRCLRRTQVMLRTQHSKCLSRGQGCIGRAVHNATSCAAAMLQPCRHNGSTTRNSLAVVPLALLPAPAIKQCTSKDSRQLRTGRRCTLPASQERRACRAHSGRHYVPGNSGNSTARSGSGGSGNRPFWLNGGTSLQRKGRLMIASPSVPLTEQCPPCWHSRAAQGERGRGSSTVGGSNVGRGLGG